MSELDIPSVIRSTAEQERDPPGSKDVRSESDPPGSTDVRSASGGCASSGTEELSGGVSLPKILQAGSRRRRVTKLEKQQEEKRISKMEASALGAFGASGEEGGGAYHASAPHASAPHASATGMTIQEEGERAVEAPVADATLTAFAAGDIGDGEFDFRPFFLSRSRGELYDRIAARCEEMVGSERCLKLPGYESTNFMITCKYLQTTVSSYDSADIGRPLLCLVPSDLKQVFSGLLEEAADLLNRGIPTGSNNASRAVGYRQAMAVLQVLTMMYFPHCFTHLSILSLI